VAVAAAVAAHSLPPGQFLPALAAVVEQAGAEDTSEYLICLHLPFLVWLARAAVAAQEKQAQQEPGQQVPVQHNPFLVPPG